MASEVDICNLALAHLGDEATVASIEPPEGSAQAEHCARFYPIARDALLEMHPWKFATRRAMLAPQATAAWNWAYAYAEPAGAVRLLAVLAADAPAQAETQPFEAQATDTGAPVILTNLPSASLLYVSRITDTTKFSPLFVDALGWLLASHLAGPILKGEAGSAMAKDCLRQFMLSLSNAKTSNANQQMVRQEHTAPWIVARG